MPIDRKLAWVLASLALLGGCHRRRNLNAVGTPDAPLILALTHAHAPRSQDQIKQLRDRLSARLGKSVEVRTFASHAEAIESFGRNEADVGLLPLFDYLLARDAHGVEAGLQVVRQGGATSYRGALLVRAASDLRTVAQLHGRRVAFVDPYSTSGFLFPARTIADAKVQPIVEFAGSHEQAIERLRAGQVDAAATFAGTEASDAAFRAIATTEPIPGEPVFFRKDLDPELRRTVAQALVALTSDAEGAALLQRFGGIHGFAPTSDATYVPVKGAVSAAGKHVEDLVPGGWSVTNKVNAVDFVHP